MQSVNCFGAYLNHLAILSEDPTVKSTDRQKLKGYLLQWRSAKMLFGCALFHDLSKPAAILCKVLHEVCIVGAIEAILKTSRAIERLTATLFDDLPTVKKVSSRIVKSEGGSTTYQDIASNPTHIMLWALCRVEELQHQLAHQCSPNIIGIWEWGICGLMGGAFIT